MSSGRPFRKALTLFDDYREMLADPVRLDAYARAIEATVKPGDVVVDLGAGLGILSLIAARAGAARVHAIEKGDAAQLMRRVVERNGFSDTIVIHEAHSRDVALERPADVLVSETLGSFALDENTLPYTRDARERLLRPGAAMIPRRLEPFLAPVELPEEHDKAAFWSEVAGFDFSDARTEMLSRMRLTTVQASSLLARRSGARASTSRPQTLPGSRCATSFRCSVRAGRMAWRVGFGRNSATTRRSIHHPCPRPRTGRRRTFPTSSRWK